jgi:DNA polymerase I
LLAHFGSLDAVLARVDEVAFLRLRGAATVAAKIRANREQALLWRQLTTIALDAPLHRVDFSRGNADATALVALCDNLRFGPLTRRRLQEATGVQTTVTVAG